MTPSTLLDALRPAALRRYGSDRKWAAACGLPPETLSRLRKRESCDLRTLGALAAAVGFALAVVPAPADSKAGFGREQEDALLDFCAFRSLDAAVWRARGDGFFMGGVAAMLASARGFDRQRYLALAEELHPGITQPEVFDLWLKSSPLRPARFLPRLERRSALAA